MHHEAEAPPRIALRIAPPLAGQRAEGRRPGQGEDVEVETAGNAAALLRGRAERRQRQGDGEGRPPDQGRASRQEVAEA